MILFCIFAGGEEEDVDYYPDQPPGGGLASYFTSTLESSFISRRGRPPVIRAAEKVRMLISTLTSRQEAGFLATAAGHET